MSRRVQVWAPVIQVHDGNTSDTSVFPPFRHHLRWCDVQRESGAEQPGSHIWSTAPETPGVEHGSHDHGRRDAAP